MPRMSTSPFDVSVRPLPEWGPYSKRLAGVSHIPDRRLGARLDVSVFPAFYRGAVRVPDARWESGWHPWEASSDLRYVAFRHELEWKDRVYADVSYSAVNEKTRLIRCECVNATDAPQSLAVHLLAGLAFPEVRPGSDEVLDEVTPHLPEKHVFVRAADYDTLEFATPRPTDTLAYDANRRGEIRGQGFTGGSGIGQGFAAEAGDRVQFRFDVEGDFANARLLVRMRGRTTLAVEGIASGRIRSESEEFTLRGLKVGPLPAGTHRLSLEGTGAGPAEIDSVILVEAGEADRTRFSRRALSDRPAIERGNKGRSLELHYPELDAVDPELRYCIGWDSGPSVVREFLTDHLDELLRRAAHDHVRSVITDRWRGETDGAHYTNVFIRPIVLPPRSRGTVWLWASAGHRGQAREAARSLSAAGPAAREELVAASRNRRVRRGGILGQEVMAATTLTNLVFPVRCRGRNLIHNTPGRWWNSLYTWDSGFVGLGLLELDVERSLDSLIQYLTHPEDPHRAFVHHGTPVPVQIYLFQELWNRSVDRSKLAPLYESLRRYHGFLAGRVGSSTTDRFDSHLLATWDYFYNSGGWDDYPPQVHVHRNRLQATVAPASNTAHAVRAAKILRAAAGELGYDDDIPQYDEDIERFSAALQEHAYDPASGYFSYVLHDDSGRPVAPLRHESGTNYNMGLDGAYGLVAGICTTQQTERLLSFLTDEKRLWTDIGLSTVDRSAPYYRMDGYWNGAVWFPHQWFFFKTCLDLGRPDIARKIALTALEVWETEVERSYNCYEHFIIETRRGAGWHQFSGLSTPVLLWHGAYREAGRLTFGFDVWLTSGVEHSGGGCTASLQTLGSSSGGPVTGLYRGTPDAEYHVTFDGAAVPTRIDPDGVVSFNLPRKRAGTLAISRLTSLRRDSMTRA